VSLFDFQNLSFRYPASSRFELRNFNLSVEEGTLVGVLGPNGAGKSTLLKLMAGLLRPHEGEIFFQGRKLPNIPSRDRARKIAYVPQSLHFAFPLSVREIVEMGRHPHLGRFQTMGAEDYRICDKALDLCDALEFRERSYEELSGGERQRVLLASALAQSPQTLLLDEPTLSLDLAHQQLLFGIVQKLHREEGLSVVVATHEINLAGRFMDRLLLMKDGGLVADGPPDKTLTPANIRKTHGVSVRKLSAGKDFPYFVPKPAGRRAAL
jgi:iron complex transport system ATP-binding protein